MAANDYYDSSTIGYDLSRPHHDTSLPPLLASSSSHFSKSSNGPKSDISPVSSYSDSRTLSYGAQSQQTFGEVPRYYGAGGGGTANENASYADDIPLRPQAQKYNSDGERVPHADSYESGYNTGLPDPTERSKNRDRRRRKKGFFSGPIPWVVWGLTLIQIIVFIVELVRAAILTSSPIEIHPQFNPMIGPSPYVLINMGARYVPCMKSVPGVQDSGKAISWPCPNTTSNDLDSPMNSCTLSQLCGFSGVPNPGPNTTLTSHPQPNQWFRFITPIFLHAGFIHIGFNMLLQLTLGADVEKDIGPIRFALVYFSSGIFGFVMGGNFAPNGIESTGASGALFGITALTLLDLLYKWKERKSPWVELAFIFAEVAVSFVLGLLPSLDNFSHIGGFLMGLVLGICILHSPNSLRRRIGADDPPYTPVTAARKSDGMDKSTLKAFTSQPIGFFKNRKLLWWAWWLVRAFALIGVLTCFIVLVTNFYTSHSQCGWCKHLSCLPIKNWCDVGNLQLNSVSNNGTNGTSSKRDLFGLGDPLDLQAFF